MNKWEAVVLKGFAEYAEASCVGCVIRAKWWSKLWKLAVRGKIWKQRGFKKDVGLYTRFLKLCVTGPRWKDKGVHCPPTKRDNDNKEERFYNRAIVQFQPPAPMVYTRHCAIPALWYLYNTLCNKLIWHLSKGLWCEMSNARPSIISKIDIWNVSIDGKLREPCTSKRWPTQAKRIMIRMMILILGQVRHRI